MRYSATRNWTHPVHRPGFNDWPDAPPPEMLATLDWSQDSDNLMTVSVEYSPNQDTIAKAVESGNAVCTGLVFESSALFRSWLQPKKDKFNAQAEVDPNLIGDSITVHPAIVAVRVFELSTVDAHPEYEGNSILVRKGAPIAIVPSYSTILPKELRQPESVVKFRTDENCDDGICVIDTNLEDRDIYIRANQETREKWTVMAEATRSSVFASLYLAALTQAFSKISESTSGDELDSPDMWRNVLVRSLEKYGETIKYNDDVDGVEAAEAAQLVLNNPFEDFIESWCQEVGHED